MGITDNSENLAVIREQGILVGIVVGISRYTLVIFIIKRRETEGGCRPELVFSRYSQENQRGNNKRKHQSSWPWISSCVGIKYRFRGYIIIEIISDAKYFTLFLLQYHNRMHLLFKQPFDAFH